MDADSQSREDKPSIEQQKAAQELINLQLAAEKTRIEIAQLQRPFIVSNPQLVTAVVTTVGALVGAYILISQNYFQSLRTSIDATRLLSDQSVTAAEQKRQIAEKLEAEAATKTNTAQADLEKAQELRRTAEQTEREAAARIKQANNQILEANRRVAKAIEDRDKLALEAWSIPEFVYDQQAQLSSLRLLPTKQDVTSLSWLSAPLTRLAVGVSDSIATVLTEVPTTVSVLEIAAHNDIDVLDLSKLSSRRTVTDLTVRLRDRRGILERDRRPNSVRISGLKELRSLRSLSVESDGPVTGLGDVVDLITLQRLSFIGLSKPRDIVSDFDMISKHFQQAPAAKSITRVNFRLEPGHDDYASHISGGIVPEVRTVRIFGNARGLMAALAKFPNVDDLSLNIGVLKDEPFSESRDDLLQILPWIAQRKNLHALDVEFGGLDTSYEEYSALLPSHSTLDVSDLSQLERLSFGGYDEQFKVTGLKGLTALRELRVKPAILIDKDLSVLPRLERLILEDSRADPVLLGSLAHMRSLKSLCVPLVEQDNLGNLRAPRRADLEQAYLTLLDSVPLEHLRILFPVPPISKLPVSVKNLEFAASCEDFSLGQTLVRALH
jgi:hypothetical protein